MKSFFCLISLSLCLSAPSLKACGCIGERSVKAEIAEVKGLVVGTILSSELLSLSEGSGQKGYPAETEVMHFRFLKESRYKGRFSADTLEIYTGLGHGDCGLPFEIGQKYIVYGEADAYFGNQADLFDYPKGKNILWTHICLRTRKYQANEIQKIEKYKRPKK